jgi:GAF domain
MPLFKNVDDRSFEPEQVGAMRTAFEAVLRDLQLADRDDPLVQMVAKAIIDAASEGTFDPEEIRGLALKRFSFFRAENSATTALLGDAIALARADLGNIQRYDATDRSLAIVVQRGFKEDFLRTFERVKVDDRSACARAMRAKNPIFVPDVSRDDDFREFVDVARRAGFSSVLSLPLLTGADEFIGVMSVHFATTRRSEDIRLEMLSEYARHAADGLAGIFARRAANGARS